MAVSPFCFVAFFVALARRDPLGNGAFLRFSVRPVAGQSQGKKMASEEAESLVFKDFMVVTGNLW
jgi:hypothetical protein